MEPNIWRRYQLRKLVVVLVFLTVALFLNTLVLAWLHEKTPEGPVLPDLIFDWIPYYGWSVKVAEVCVVFNGVAAILTGFLHPQRQVVVPRILFIAALLYYGRSVCIAVTLLPVPARERFCAPKQNETNWEMIVWRAVNKMIRFGMQGGEERQPCGDFIYSGHTIILTLGLCAMRQYLPKRAQHLTYLIWVTTLTGMLLTVVSRIHYTIDVVIAYYLTSRLFFWYHLVAVNNPRLDSGEEYGDLLSRIFWYPMVRFIEANGNSPKVKDRSCNGSRDKDYHAVPLVLPGEENL